MNEYMTNEWESFKQKGLNALVNYVIDVHHHTLKEEMTLIHYQLIIAAELDASLISLKNKVETLQALISSHINKEEHLLFPLIKPLRHQRDNNQLPVTGIERLLLKITLEHEEIKYQLGQLRIMTNSYNAPLKALPTLKLCMEHMNHFDRELIRQIQLEERVIFPKIRALQKAVSDEMM